MGLAPLSGVQRVILIIYGASSMPILDHDDYPQKLRRTQAHWACWSPGSQWFWAVEFVLGAVALLYELGRKHGSRLGADEKSAPWCARSFRSLHAMRISVALHTASATEILETIQLDVASDVAHGNLA